MSDLFNSVDLPVNRCPLVDKHQIALQKAVDNTLQLMLIHQITASSEVRRESELGCNVIKGLTQVKWQWHLFEARSY